MSDKPKALFLGGRELERAVGLSRFIATRLALRGELAFELSGNGSPQFSVIDAMRIVAERAHSARFPERVLRAARLAPASRTSSVVGQSE